MSVVDRGAGSQIGAYLFLGAFLAQCMCLFLVCACLNVLAFAGVRRAHTHDKLLPTITCYNTNHCALPGRKILRLYPSLPTPQVCMDACQF